MQNLILLLAMPREVFESLKSRSQWSSSFIVVVIGLILKNWINSCWIAQSLTFNITMLVVTTISITIIIFISWSFISTFLYWAIYLIKTNNIVTYNRIFSIVSYCGVIFLLGEILNFLLIHAQLIPDSLFVLPHRFPIGLDVLVMERNPHPALAILLYSINPFTFWYLMTMSIGLSTVTGLSKTKARVLSFMIYLLIVGFVIGVLLITGGTRISIKFGA
jgi:hypothetical protein